MKDVLICATTTSGAQSVMMDGTTTMLVWLADKLASHLPVHTKEFNYTRIAIFFSPHTDAAVGRSALFGRGTGPILLDEVACTGSESSLFRCPNRGIGNHNCGHHEDASVICTGIDPQ